MSGMGSTLSSRKFLRALPIPLDEQQRAAVCHGRGPALLLAVPGSGKTTVLVARLGHLVRCLGVNPRSILTMTYTVAATRDMGARCAQLFGPELAETLEFRTLNGVCARIIRRYERTLNRSAFTLAGEEGELSRLVRELALTQSGRHLTDSEVKDLRQRIAYCKNGMLGTEELEGIKVEGLSFPALYRAYQDHLTARRLMDYDDQLVYALRILRAHPQILGYFQARYPYLCVDEAQDTSKIQHAILRLLAGEGQNLFLVGDEDQSIYGFRAACPQALLDFTRTYPGARVLLMERNYRCTAAIAERADAFIQRNAGRHPKHMTAQRPGGAPIRRTQLPDRSQQGAYLLELARKSGGETAILYRNNDSALPLIDLLERQGVPYCCRQLEGTFFTHYIVRDIADAILLALDPTDAARFFSLYYKLGTGLKRETAQDILVHHRREPDRPVLDVALETPGLTGRAVQNLRFLQGQLARLGQDGSLPALKRITGAMGYGAFLQSRGADTAKVSVLMALAHQNPDLHAFLLRLDQLRDIAAAGSGGEGGVVLSTIHSSKGLEYDRVVLIDIRDGLFPCVDPRAENALSQEEREALEEERRLFYVGVTRAKNHLELVTCAREYGSPAPAATFADQLLPPPPETRKSTSPSALSAVCTVQQARLRAREFVPGSPVRHSLFGPGTVQGVSSGIAAVAFADGTTRKFDLTACLQKGLLALETGGT